MCIFPFYYVGKFRYPFWSHTQILKKSNIRDKGRRQNHWERKHLQDPEVVWFFLPNKNRSKLTKQPLHSQTHKLSTLQHSSWPFSACKRGRAICRKRLIETQAATKGAARPVEARGTSKSCKRLQKYLQKYLHQQIWKLDLFFLENKNKNMFFVDSLASKRMYFLEIFCMLFEVCSNQTCFPMSSLLTANPQWLP